MRSPAEASVHLARSTLLIDLDSDTHRESSWDLRHDINGDTGDDVIAASSLIWNPLDYQCTHEVEWPRPASPNAGKQPRLLANWPPSKPWNRFDLVIVGCR